MPEPSHGYTVNDLCRRWRCGPDKVRAWIKGGELSAINAAAVLSGRPQYRITPEALAAFERGRSAAPPPKPQRRRRNAAVRDYYPD